MSLVPQSFQEPNSHPPKSARRVLSALQQLNHATAPDILAWINRNFPTDKKLSLTSVYRGLNYWVEQGDIKPLNFNDGQVRYELNSHHHHHHLVCITCDSVQVLDHCPLEPVLAEVKDRFQVSYHNFEIFGRCQECLN